MIANIDNCIDPRGREYLDGIFKDIAFAMGVNTPAEAIELLNKMLVDMVMPQPLDSDRCISIDILTQSVNPIRLKNNPVCLNEDTIRDLYLQIVK